MQINTTTQVRQRGQLTIPNSIRKRRQWAKSGSVVSISSEKPDEITIKPYSPKHAQTDWKKLWADMKRVRALKGKGRGNLSAFIAKDKQTRR